MPHIHAPGLVLQLDPQMLAAHGASYTWGDEPELSAQQYFVCIEADAKEALWLPLFAGPAAGRKGIAATAKTGDPRWTRSSSFFHPAQVCKISHKAVQRAAEAAYDRSTPKQPNRLATTQLPAREELPAADAFHAMAGSLQTR